LESLIAMRFLQALGGCVGMVAAQAFVRDLFPMRKTAQAFSSIILVIAVSPMIAPTLGGYITVAFGWHSVFIILAVLTLLILTATYFLLPEGKPADPEISLKPKSILSNFILVVKQPQFSIYTVASYRAGVWVDFRLCGLRYDWLGPVQSSLIKKVHESAVS
jgi:DHA1 family bicyclomycin/chloramphenicol resistance-like MFS transporter